MKRYNHFLYGFVPGLLLPVVFLWIYLSINYPEKIPFIEIIKRLFSGVMLGKLLLLSIFPNLIIVFVFYKQDSFKLGIGFMIAAMLYLIVALFMM